MSPEELRDRITAITNAEQGPSSVLFANMFIRLIWPRTVFRQRT